MTKVITYINICVGIGRWFCHALSCIKTRA
nr:MAG TPA: hypothetical protein [Caudoviricetes sp.]